MTVSVDPYKNKRSKPQKEYLFIFPDCESMISGIVFLYRRNLYLKSTLYKTENEYRLIIKSKKANPCFLTLSEFCKSQSLNIIDAAFTKEYGKLLIGENAIKTIGKCFLKAP